MQHLIMMSICLFFNSSRSLLIDSCIVSILFSRFLIIFTIIILSSFSDNFPISSSFIWTSVFLVCSFICAVFLSFHFLKKFIVFEISFFQASRKVEFFPWRSLNSFFLLISALLRFVQWFSWASYRVRFVLSFHLFVFFLMSKAEWGGNPACWWLGLYFCFVCCLNELSCTGCYWWLKDARSCIQVAFFVWVLTIWYSVGLVL